MEFITGVDFKILEFIQSYIRCDFLDSIVPHITRLGDGGILWILIGGILAVIPKTRRCGFSILIGLLLCLIVGNMWLKPLIARERPCRINSNIDMLIGVPHDCSFPSGHTLAAFVFAFIIWFENKKIGAFAFVLAALIGFSRLYLYVHFPTDVLGGIILAGVLAYFVKLVFIDWMYPKIKNHIIKT